MNTNFDMAYLSGGDDYFGPDYGGVTVYTNVREGFMEACPNVGRFLQNLVFNLTMENEVMGMILNDGLAPEKAAEKWLRENRDVLDQWLKGVTTIDGKDGLETVRSALQ